MPRRPTRGLTPLELEIMKVLWRRGPSAVQAVQAGLGGDRPLAYNTGQALLNALLKKGKGRRERRERAYGHAARYWSRLREIADSGVGLLPLQSHEEFEAEIRARHGRKSAFWAYVNGTRRDRHDDEDDLTR